MIKNGRPIAIFLAVSVGAILSGCAMLLGNGSEPADTAPIAEAAFTSETIVGTEITLDGAGSIDPDGDAITYSWTLSSTPTGCNQTSLNITNRTSEFARFAPDTAGQYVIRLTVTANGKTSMDSAQLMVLEDTSGDTNAAPTADAGADQDATVGSATTLNGVASDADDDPLTYVWSVVAVPDDSGITNAGLNGSTTLAPWFTPDQPGQYELQLTVSDGQDSASDTVVVTATAVVVNNPPEIDAGTEQTLSLGDTVTLSGTATDPEEDAMTYQWTFVSTPDGSTLTGADITGAAVLSASFDPDLKGEYVLQLAVSDGTNDEVTDTVAITIGNTPPTAYAGTDRTTIVETAITLSATAGDTDGDSLTYSWAVVSVPGGSAITLADVSGSDTLTPSFTPDILGSYELELTVSDGEDAATDSVVVTAVDDTSNVAPDAGAGSDQSVSIYATVELTGEASDANDDLLTTTWTFAGKPTGSGLTDTDISNATELTASFVPDAPGLFELQLSVDDGELTSSDTVEINVTNQPPTVDAGTDLTGAVGEEVTVPGAGTDPEGADVTYNWSFVSVPDPSARSNADISNPDTATAAFVPDAPGTYTLKLTVSDGFASASGTVDIVVGVPTGSLSVTIDISPPTGPQITFNPPTFELNKGADGGAETISVNATTGFLSYEWRIDGTPAGANSATIIVDSADIDDLGVHTLQLIVIDGSLNRYSSEPLWFSVVSE